MSDSLPSSKRNGWLKSEKPQVLMLLPILLVRARKTYLTTVRKVLSSR
ncbi:unnamed protein product [Nippostrongylus brasiliensis]|uniref:Uncharacterized protein n=1 Tax=Nippostrongylus brasiliensis TaxID=27835 RepID=A0A0N4XP16_NIPBR|nr:unnamed protein product [Nippostrongylus brasiliensis]